MLYFEKISLQNVNTAISVQETIFPNESGKQDLLNEVNNDTAKHLNLMQHYIVKHKNCVIGIVGLYAYRIYPEDAWLGWFGILPKYRGNGFGEKTLMFAKTQALKLGFRNLRLYTDEIDNEIATKLYEKIGMEKEIYNNENDKCWHIGHILIYSIALKNKICNKWENKNLYLNLHEEINKN